jgi:hypothetical protein
LASGEPRLTEPRCGQPQSTELNDFEMASDVFANPEASAAARTALHRAGRGNLAADGHHLAFYR